jgi:eukaryotic-like serine/threonine-protein kinase
VTIPTSPAGDDDELQLVDRVIAGTFRLRACIASGSSGSVYRADQIALGRTVAVKILRPELALDPRFVSRFHGEALAASRLNHPNTVAVIDYGQTDDGLLYLAMEHLRGLPLSAIVASEHPLDRARVVDYMTQIAAGVEEAHDAGVIHADLKPENVVVEHRRGGWDLVKVVDFGIARLLGQPREGEDVNVICGTPEYMAPEVIRGGDPVVASDIYALGVMLYELCAGQPPFLGDGSVEILTAHLKDEPPPLAELTSDTEMLTALEPVVRRALRKDPGDRYSSAAAFREALTTAAGRARSAATRTVVCAGCSARIASTFKFCSECGRSMEEAPASPARRMGDGAASPTLYREDAPGLVPLRFCGHTRAIHRARAFARQASGALHIAGRAGSGKTRLLREVFADAAHSEPRIAVYITTPDPTGLRVPHYPMRALLTAVLDLPALCPYPELERAALEIGLNRRDVPGLAEMLAHRSDLSELEPMARQREIAASARRVLIAAAARHPMMIVFEDADRYDAPSQRLLASLVGQAGESALRIAVTTGMDGDASVDPMLASLPCEKIELGPLSEAAVGDIAADVARRSEVRLPPAAELRELSRGDPAYLNELARYALEGGSVAEAPEGIADLVDLRLELLPQRALLVAQALAVSGLEASEAAIAAAVGDRVGKRDRARAIAHLEARGLISASDTLRFERQLIRDIVYDRTPAQTRRALHAACLGERLDTAAQRGHHLEGAGRWGEAAVELARAADEAARELDDAGAIAMYQRALECARRAMLSAVDEDYRRLFIEISIKLGDALARTQNVGLARGIVDEALGHCHGAPALKAQLLRAIGHVHAANGDLAAAAASLRQAIGLGIMSGERELLARLYLDLATHQVEAGQVSKAIFELTEAIDLITAGEGGRASHAPPSLWCLALRLGKLHADRGDHERALALGVEAEKLAKRVGSRLGMARVQAMLAAQCEALGQNSRAARYRARAADTMRALGDRRATVELLLSGARLTRRLRRIDPDTLTEARTLSEEIGWTEGSERARLAES